MATFVCLYLLSMAAFQLQSKTVTIETISPMILKYLLSGSLRKCYRTIPIIIIIGFYKKLRFCGEILPYTQTQLSPFHD